MTVAKARYTSIGGQAVIEGVMMRSPGYIAVAVRRPDHKIVIRSYPHQGLGERYPFFRRPVIRGVVNVLESMFQGIEALGYSAQVASEEEGSGEQLSTAAIVFSIISAFVLGVGLFVALPHLLTALFASGSRTITPESVLFHVVDGVIKIAILLAYVWGISRIRDIRRVFQFHGAEHKSIYTFEQGLELTVENARRQTTLHPRCGTTFLLFLVVISIAVFSVVFPLFSLGKLSTNPVLNHGVMVVLKIFLMLPVAGLAYEFIRVCAFRMDRPFYRALIWPGLTLQKLTTAEPEDDQLEVALASLRQVLRLEKGIPSPIRQSEGADGGAEAGQEEEFAIAGLSELGAVQAGLGEFPER